MAILRNKMFWMGTLGVLVVLMVFGVAMMGSVVGAKPQNIPIALVMQDQAAALPNGEEVAVGQMIQEQLLANSQLPVKWELVESAEQARSGLDQQAYYGALVLPADLSSGMLSLLSDEPKPGVVSILVNEGMNTQASTAARQILQQAMKSVSGELSKQVVAMSGTQSAQAGQSGEASAQISVAAAMAAMAPLQITEEIVHPVGLNNASGNAPGMLTQIMWIAALVISLILFLITQKMAVLAGPIKTRKNKLSLLLSQSIAGIGLLALVSGFLLWMASSWYGMELSNALDIWLFLWLAGTAFYLIQSTLLGWVGFPAMGILVLLMFFSMPLLNMAPEFLPQATRDWLYSWTPLQFAASGLRNVMYFDGSQPLAPNVAILWSIAGAFLLLLLASGFKKGKAAKVEAGHVSAAAAL